MIRKLLSFVTKIYIIVLTDFNHNDEIHLQAKVSSKMYHNIFNLYASYLYIITQSKPYYYITPVNILQVCRRKIL